MPETQTLEREAPLQFYVDLVDQLIALGYLKYAPPEDLTEFRTAMIFSLYDLNIINLDWFRDGTETSCDWRVQGVDEQAICGGYALKELHRLQPLLEREGVILAGWDDEYFEDHYDLLINGQRFPLRGSLRMEPFTSHAVTAEWGIPYKNFLLMLNALLEQAGSRERFYSEMVRIELHCRILTPPMFELMQSAQLDDLFRPFSAESIDENGRYPCIIL